MEEWGRLSAESERLAAEIESTRDNIRRVAEKAGTEKPVVF